MTIVRHELKQGRMAFLIWTGVLAFMLMVCIVIFPEMKSQMADMNDMLSSMGAVSEAFGMDQLNFSTLIGYYVVECGNVLGLGGALFAAMCASLMLSKEESGRTAEFLLSHPVSRVRIITEKLFAVILEITAMNLIVYIISMLSIMAIGESGPWKEFNLVHLAYYILQLELAGICYGISAFIRKGGLGVGLGVGVIMYFLNIISNLTDSAKGLKYITPFSYCEGADIVNNGALTGKYLVVGVIWAVIGIIAAYIYYSKKDIQ
ncbi:MAG: ABC transporter permease subunit [Lachnospiraceae bacterium]|nr:ABC transporter permease subunit [Lachnospiraceae bacterium]